MTRQFPRAFGEAHGPSIRLGRAISSAFVALLVLSAILATPNRGVSADATAGSPASKAPADSILASPDSTAGSPGCIAFYFHTTLRCVSCRKIEAYAQEAIEKGFAAELKDGRLVWKVVNIEEKGNEHFAQDYQLFTKSVILVDQRAASPRWKNLPKVWELLGDKEAFLRYIQAETRTFLASEKS
jgi:hypothetical protein